MISAQFVPFFTASTGAGAALVGLLFVAIAVAPESIFGRNAPPERRAVATSAFTALVNAFFVSFGALIPDTSAAYIAMALSGAALIATVRLGASLVTRGLGLKRIARRLALVVISAVLYALEGLYGVQILRGPDAAGPVLSLAGLVLAIYGMAILRAWELLGAERDSLLGQLSLLRDVERRRAGE